MSGFVVFLVVAGVVALIVVWAGILFCRYYKRCWARVLKVSRFVREIGRLNSHFKGREDIKSHYKYIEKCKSKKQFDKREVSEACYEYIYENFEFYADILAGIRVNRYEFPAYESRYNMITADFSRDDCRVARVPYLLFLVIEKRYYNKSRHKKVAMQTQLEYKLKYTSPAGKNRYVKGEIFDFMALEEFISRVEKERKYRASERYRRKKERSRVTASVRYDVLVRDEHKCVICGRGRAEGVKLHVDHIVPIAKGGSSDLANLQTLCQDCNLGKGVKA